MIIHCTKCFQAKENGLGPFKISQWCRDCREAASFTTKSYNGFVLTCQKCGAKVHETFKGDLCQMCYHVESSIKKQWVGLLTKQAENGEMPMKKGEIKKLPKDQAPVWSEQWAVQGTGKIPYIITHKLKEKNTELIWQCSCPAWTTTTPREDCKHILKVKLNEGISLSQQFADGNKAQLLAGISQLIGGLGLPTGNAHVHGNDVVTAKKQKGMALDTFEKKGRKFR